MYVNLTAGEGECLHQFEVRWGQGQLLIPPAHTLVWEAERKGKQTLFTKLKSNPDK